MLKKLLYLYNDGHNPFPHSGRGGLGYHLPQYRKRMHGEALHIYRNTDGSVKEIIDDHNNEDLRFIDEQPSLNPVSDALETREMRDVLIEANERLLNEKSKKRKAEKTSKVIDQIIHEIDDVLKERKEREEKENEEKENEEKFLENVLEKEVKLKPTSKDDIFKIQEKLKDIVGKKYFDISLKILSNYPNITYEEFIKDISNYIKGAKKQTKEETKEKSELNAIIKDVNKLMKEGNDENKGTAYEKVMIEKGQDILKENSESKEDFVLCASNPIYLNPDTGKPIMVKFHGNIEPLSKFTLYDIENPSSISDCKYYPESDYASIQLSKLEGNVSFTPCWKYNEKEDKYTLYNIWCKETNSWTETTNNKEVGLNIYLKDKNVHNYSISNLINNWKKININGKLENGCPMKQVVINGKATKYFCPNAPEIVNAMGKKIYTKKGNNYTEWFDLLPNEMTIVNTKYVNKPKIETKSKIKKSVKNKNV